MRIVEGQALCSTLKGLKSKAKGETPGARDPERV